MRFDYLILAHDAFDQLERLIARLLAGSEHDRVILHVDAKSRIPGRFLDTLAAPERVRVVPVRRRVPVRWGHWSQCAATLALLDAALDGEADFLHLLSGRDWPLADRATIARDIERADGRDCFVEIDVGASEARMQRFRFGDRWLGDALAQHPLGWRAQVAMRIGSAAFSELARRYGYERPRPLGGWVKGSQWWSLPRDGALHAQAALRATLDSGRLRHTECSDEHVLPTALFRSRFAARLAPARRLTRWSPGSSRPDTLRRETLGDVGGAWFARKFDAGTDDFFYRL